jgi:hypothetical protein
MSAVVLPREYIYIYIYIYIIWKSTPLQRQFYTEIHYPVNKTADITTYISFRYILSNHYNKTNFILF